MQRDWLVEAVENEQPLCRLSYSSAGIPAVVGGRSWMRAALAGGHVVLLRRPACLDILAAIVMNLPRPLQGLPAPNGFQPNTEVVFPGEARR